jgi:hypothetical protein
MSVLCSEMPAVHLQQASLCREERDPHLLFAVCGMLDCPSSPTPPCHCTLVSSHIDAPDIAQASGSPPQGPTSSTTCIR